MLVDRCAALRGSGYDASMTAMELDALSSRAMEYIFKPCAVAVCFVLVALLWTFPLQHV